MSNFRGPLQQAIDVFVDAALLGRVRVTEVDLDAGVDVHGFPVLHFDVLVPGQGMPQRLGERLDLGCQSVSHLLGLVSVRQVHEHRVIGGPLNQRPNRGLIPFPDDEIASQCPGTARS